MQWISKTVLTLVKWVLGKVVNEWLLKFGKKEKTIACVNCPELCRFSCGVAVGTANDALTPRKKVASLYLKKDFSSPYDCTLCGRCTDYCLHGVKVWDILRDSRENSKQPFSQKIKLQFPKSGSWHWAIGESEMALSLANQSSELIDEPFCAFFRNENKLSWRLSWFEDRFKITTDFFKNDHWFIIESPFFSRHLKKSHEIESFFSQLKNVRFPYEKNSDALDIGLEGPYFLQNEFRAKKISEEFFRKNSIKKDEKILVFSKVVKERLSSMVSNEVFFIGDLK